MTERNVTVVAEAGLHARPAAELANLVKGYPGKVEMLRDTRTADLKSVINIMTMGVKAGTEVTIRVTGEGEAEMLDKVIEFIENIRD